MDNGAKGKIKSHYKNYLQIKQDKYAKQCQNQ